MAIQRNVLTRSTNNNQAEDKPFDGCWINVGITVRAEDGTESFVKLPLGIPVDSLKDRRIYNSTNAEYAEQSAHINDVMGLIREKAVELEAGESVPLALAVELYRKQDEAETAPAPKQDMSSLRESLFGG